MIKNSLAVHTQAFRPGGARFDEVEIRSRGQGGDADPFLAKTRREAQSTLPLSLLWIILPAVVLLFIVSNMFFTIRQQKIAAVERFGLMNQITAAVTAANKGA